MDKYEKLYNEVLEQAKKELATCGSMDCDAARLIFRFFPQLRESEDERIRKELIEKISNLACGCFISQEQKQNFITYLEKQKKPHYTKRNALFDKCVAECDPEIMQRVSDEIDEMLEKEQKPYEPKNWPADKNNLTQEQKPAEWNEEDKNGMFSDIIMAIRAFYKCEREDLVDYVKSLSPIKKEWSKEDEENLGKLHRLLVICQGEKKFIPSDEYDKLDNWLKSLRPHLSDEEIKKIRSEEYTKGFNDAAFGGQLKEWGAEDEDRIRQIEWIAQQAGCTQKLQEEIHDWLKSLRSSWKPSEEQMDVLNKMTLGNFLGSGQYDILRTLYEDLLKLKGGVAPMRDIDE